MQTRLWWRLRWGLESGCRFCGGEFGRAVASVAVKIFPHLIYLKFFYIFSTPNAIRKDNAEINYIIL